MWNESHAHPVFRRVAAGGPKVRRSFKIITTFLVCRLLAPSRELEWDGLQEAQIQHARQFIDLTLFNPVKWVSLQNYNGPPPISYGRCPPRLFLRVQPSTMAQEPTLHLQGLHRGRRPVARSRPAPKRTRIMQRIKRLSSFLSDLSCKCKSHP